MKFGEEADNERKHPGKKETVQKDMEDEGPVTFRE